MNTIEKQINFLIKYLFYLIGGKEIGETTPNFNFPNSNCIFFIFFHVLIFYLLLFFLNSFVQRF